MSTRNGQRAFVVGVGMTKFDKPGTKSGDYPDWAASAAAAALEDAGVPFERIESAYTGFVYADSAAGQRSLYGLGTTGIPMFNVNNWCSTGSTALFLARQAVAHGAVDCALALGFEKMSPGSLDLTFSDRVSPFSRHFDRMAAIQAPCDSPWAPQMFGEAGNEHMRLYDSNPGHFAWIAWKNHKHSVNNPNAQFQAEFTIEQIESSRMIHDPLTKLQCSPTSDGAAAAVIASERFVEENGLWTDAVEIAGMAMTSDLSSSFDESAGCISIVGADMSREAARACYEEAEAGASDVDVCELHDCFSTNEMITYEALGFAAEGEGPALVESRATTYGGEGPVVNPSGGLISKGHPLGATGLAQCSELVWQLRGQADRRQVDEATVGLQHNIGLGGAAIVALYRPAAG